MQTSNIETSDVRTQIPKNPTQGPSLYFLAPGFCEFEEHSFSANSQNCIVHWGDEKKKEILLSLQSTSTLAHGHQVLELIDNPMVLPCDGKPSPPPKTTSPHHKGPINDRLHCVKWVKTGWTINRNYLQLNLP